MYIIRPFLAASFALLLVLVLSPSDFRASEKPPTIYTVQLGSFTAASAAQKEYDAIVQLLEEEERDYLRIEKIGRYYTLRLGKFDNPGDAEQLRRAIKARIPTATAMDAYYKEARISRLYERPEVGKPLPAEVPEKKAPPEVTKKAVGKPDAEKKDLSVEEQIRMIASLIETRDYQQASKLAKAGITSLPDEPELNGWYGVALLKMNKPAEALRYFSKASSLSPDVSDYHNGVGYCLYFLNRFDRAVDEFSRAVDLEPAHVDALTGLGITYVKTGKKEKARDVYEKLKAYDADAADRLLKVIELKTL